MDKIEEIHLFKNRISDIGFNHFALTLKNIKCNNLSLIDLGDNNLTDNSIKSLCIALFKIKCS